ncbi:MAG: hypothetical protein DMF96_28405 [Acidobacteria bacterium]|nr:MAG: hypothetical protein DMF96_28405 [Acidobacteriota bacterium]
MPLAVTATLKGSPYHVNLGFNKGATLPDPAGLLKGTGTSVRHVTLKSLDDLKRPEICAYLRTARASAGENEASRRGCGGSSRLW